MLRRTSKIMLTLALVIILAVPSISFVTGEGKTKTSNFSRTYVEESEPNNDWPSANQLTSTPGSTYDLHGNITTSDYDFFYFNLNGGSGPVDQVTITPKWVGTDYSDQVFVAWIWSFYPTNSLTHSPSDEISKAVGIWWENPYSWWSPLTFNADHSGIYGMIIRPASSLTGTLEYNLTIRISSVTPVDPNNDQGSSMEITGLSQVISADLNTNLDQWDWFHLNAPDPLHPTTLDLTFSMSNYSPDRNDGTYDWSVEVIITVFYNSRANTGTFNKQSFSISPSKNFQDAGSLSPPANIKITKNCTEMYISMLILTYGMDTGGNIQYSSNIGETDYNARFNIIPEIPNNRPYLKNLQFSPERGRSSDLFRFSVDYYDANNETPAAIWLWKNGEEFRELYTDAGGSNLDHTTGVTYFAEIPGSILGKNKAHTLNISASDGEDWAINFPDALDTFTVIVDDNLPPSPSVGDIYEVEMEEDESTREIELDPLFTDPDPGTKFTFSIKDPDGNWGLVYKDDNIIASIRKPQSSEDNTLLLLTPKENVYGTFYVTINATDDGYFEKHAKLTIEIIVHPVNDIPVIARIGGMAVDDQDTFIRFQKEQDEKVELDVLAFDIDEEDVLSYHWNIDEALIDPVENVTYYVNSSSGEMWFIPRDEDVPQVDLLVTVKDGNGGESSMEVIVEVDNKNDPPVITLPATRSTIEGEFLYINPHAYDPDLDSGDELIFGYDLGELAAFAPPNSISFDPYTGRLVIEAIAEEMNGEWEITITVSDLALLSDSATCSIIIQNINDDPVAQPVYADTTDGNLTVEFSTGKATDEDGDTLTYIWNFGDGSPEVHGVDLRYVEHVYENEGSYLVSMKVFDGISYSEEETVLLSLIGPEPDPDQDDDGIPDEWEIRYGLDPKDPLDAHEDPDNDGLTNLEEYELNEKYGWSLNPRNPDTDGDGWTDGKEVALGFNPMDASDHPQDKYEGFPFLIYMVSALIIVLSLIFIVVFFVLRKRNKPQAVPSAVYPAPLESQPPEALEPGSYQQVQSGEVPESIAPARFEDMQYATDTQYNSQGFPQQYEQDPAMNDSYGQEEYPQQPEEYSPPTGELPTPETDEAVSEDLHQQPPLYDPDPNHIPEDTSSVEDTLPDNVPPQGNVSSIPEPPSPPEP